MLNPQAAKNLPKTACVIEIGSVRKSSMVPNLRSSAHSRIESAGTKNRYSHGWNSKKGTKSAWSRSRKLPIKKVSTPASIRKITINTYASGVAKYAANSLINISLILRI